MGEFSQVLQGSYGDEKVVSTSKIGSLPLGQEMVLPDGRRFVHSRVGGTALVAGKLYQGVAQADTAAIATLTCATAAVGATSLTVTAGGTAVTNAYYDDGYLTTASSVGTGIGYTYKVKTNNSAAASSTFTVTLQPNDSIKVATEGGTTTVGLRANENALALLTTADTVSVNTIIGVSCATAAASSYCWLQNRGIASVFTDATTLVVGNPVIASSTVAGAVGVFAGTAGAVAKGMRVIGTCLSPAASAQFSTIDLNI